MRTTKIILCLLFICAIPHQSFSELTLKQKVGQLFITFFHGKKLTPKLKKHFKNSHIGNVILYKWANDLTDRQQISELTTSLTTHLTSINGLPPFISIDQEGGRVTRLKDEFGHFPSAETIGSAGDPLQAYLAGKKIGNLLSSLNINLNFAPVVDVNSNPNNPVIGDRAFSSDPKQVVLFGRQMIQGMKEEGVLTTLKHFPGHGDTEVDSHRALPIMNKSINELEAVEFFPFKELCQEADCVMTAHIILSAISNEPATFSAPLIQDLLRKKWDFQGLIITDSLTMGAITADSKTINEAANRIFQAAKKAFLAGCDLLLIGRVEQDALETDPINDHLLIEKVIASFHEAVKNGTIPIQRVEESLKRIKKIKKCTLKTVK